MLLCAWGLSFYYSLFLLFRGSSPATIGIGVAGLFTISSVAVASFFDFGLYLPANMLLMSLFCGFLAYHAQSLSSRLKKRNWLSIETPNSFAQMILLITFAALAMFALDFYRKWQIQSVVRGDFRVRKFAFDHPNLAETDELIATLKPKVEQTRYSEGVDYMARLLIHRCRLQALEQMSSGSEAPERLWERTSLDLIQETAWALQQDGRVFSAAEFLREDFIRDNLPWARQYLLENRAIDPMEPHTHLMLGQVNAIIGKASTASQDIERAISLAPSQIDLKYLAGFYYLQTGKQKKAALHLRDLLDNDPLQFKKVMKIIFGDSNRNFASIDELTVARDVIPDNASLLYKLAITHLKEGSRAKSLALTRAIRILTDLSASDRKPLLLRARVLFEMGEYADAIDQFESYLDSRPGDYSIHLEVADIHMKLSDLETAKAKLKYIITMADKPDLKSRSLKMLNRIEKQQKESNSDSSEN